MRPPLGDSGSYLGYKRRAETVGAMPALERPLRVPTTPLDMVAFQFASWRRQVPGRPAYLANSVKAWSRLTH